jgi:hypothetical protein
VGAGGFVRSRFADLAKLRSSEPAGTPAVRRHRGPSALFACGGIAVVRAGGTPALRGKGMQDFGMGAFNGWDDFQDVVIEFLVLLIGAVERS